MNLCSFFFILFFSLFSLDCVFSINLSSVFLTFSSAIQIYCWAPLVNFSFNYCTLNARICAWFFFVLFLNNFYLLIYFLYLMRHFHHSFHYTLKYDCLLFLEHIYKGNFVAFVKFDVWASSQTFSPACFPCVWVTLFCFFSCLIIFCWWTALDTDSPLPLDLILVVCMFICWITWLDNFSELYISYSGKLFVLLLIEYRLGCVHSHSGTFSFTELSVKLLGLIFFFFFNHSKLLRPTNCQMIALFFRQCPGA